MSDYIYRHPGNKYGESPEKVTADVACPIISAQIDVNAATGTIEAVEIPAGALVYRVAMIADTAVAGDSGDIDVGDGSDPDLYADAISALAANVMAVAPIPGAAAEVAECGGKYYSSADTIDVTVNATAAAGSIRVLVWYAIDDTGIYS